MEFKKLDHYFTGVAVPLGALRTKESCGIGEFPDIEALGRWCRECGIEIIQILPVNDTGFQSSPYSALSAFALHPIFARIQNIPEFNLKPEFKSKLDAVKKEYDSYSRIPFNKVLNDKLILLKEIYNTSLADIKKSTTLTEWIKEHSWIKAYAVYNLMKNRFDQGHWKYWPELQNPTADEIDTYWNTHIEETLFYAWLQLRLEEQLAGASKAIESIGICLKGDIPIMMNEDSADVWSNRNYFDITNNAGAPPDMFSKDGQNWGFPVYNWKNLKKDDYSWWRLRLKQADKFYHAYRIDHVLGFFRIWQIPAKDSTGLLGHYAPYEDISMKQLEKIGFDEGRVRWLSVPHINGWDIQFKHPEVAVRLKEKYLEQLGNEDLYNISKSLDGEKAIWNLDEDLELRQFLVKWYKNRTLIKVDNDRYQRQWLFHETKGFQSLNFEEKMRMESLIRENEEKAEKTWEIQGEKLLSMMQKTTNMLMCAEDLGVVPSCVPKILKKLNILSLKIERWTRAYDTPGHPYIENTRYPLLSVCTPSVHDTSTLRGWWEEELDFQQKKEYYSLINPGTHHPETYTRKLAEEIIDHNLSSASLFTILQLQDLLFLNEKLDMNLLKEDRINIPGTVTDTNWTYRMPVFLEELQDNTNYNLKLKQIISKRLKKKINK